MSQKKKQSYKKRGHCHLQIVNDNCKKVQVNKNLTAEAKPHIKNKNYTCNAQQKVLAVEKRQCKRNKKRKKHKNENGKEIYATLSCSTCPFLSLSSFRHVYSGSFVRFFFASRLENQAIIVHYGWFVCLLTEWHR